MFAQRVLGGLGEAGHHGGEENAGRDGDDADGHLGEVPGDGEGHGDDAAFGGGIGGLADLAFIGGHRSGVDDDAAFLADEVRGGEAGGEFGEDVEGADKVDGDDLGEFGEVVGGTFTVHRFGGDADAGAVDEDAGDAVGDFGGFQGLGYGGFVGDVGLEEFCAEFGGFGFAAGAVTVQNGDFGAAGGQKFGGGAA